MRPKLISILSLLAVIAFQMVCCQIFKEPFCYGNYCFNKNSVYAFFYEELPFARASKLCKNTEGQLAAIRDADTNSFINKMRSQSRFRGYWVDVFDWESQGKGDAVAFSGWSRDVARRGEDATGANRCPYLDMSLNLDWANANCNTDQLPYICEYPATSQNQGLRCVSGGSCYEVVHRFSKLSDARRDCVSRGGSLALIESKDTHQALKSIVYSRRVWLNISEEANSNSAQQSVNTFDSWVGVHKAYPDWIFLDGSRVKFTNWLAAVPTRDPKANCVVYGDFWNTIDCGLLRDYLCEFPQGSNSSVNSAKCLDGICYTLNKPSVTQSAAVAACKNRGGKLAVIKSQKIDAFLKDLYKSGYRYWIGIIKAPAEFQYSDGTPITFADWESGQPKQLTEEGVNCPIALKENNKWRNANCNQNLNFICEYGSSTGSRIRITFLLQSSSQISLRPINVPDPLPVVATSSPTGSLVTFPILPNEIFGPFTALPKEGLDLSTPSPTDGLDLPTPSPTEGPVTMEPTSPSIQSDCTDQTEGNPPGDTKSGCGIQDHCTSQEERVKFCNYQARVCMQTFEGLCN